MTRPSGLGRGLGALIPAASPGHSGLRTVSLDALEPNPRQPRDDFEEAALDELAHSIREHGILQPIVVRPAAVADRYEIVAGERRFRAARRAGLSEVAVVVRHTRDDALLTEALVENLHRSDLNPVEEALAYQQLLDDFGMTHDVLATKLGRSRSAITNTLRLLGLPVGLQEQVAAGLLSAGHARALLALPDAAQQERVAQRIAAEGLSVRATEELVRTLVTPRDAEQEAGDLARAAAARSATPYAHVQERLTDALSTKVRITGTQRRGRVVIDYAGPQDLERLLDVLSRGTGEDLLSG